MKKLSYPITAFVLLICLSGCDGSENSAVTDTGQDLSKPKTGAKLSARSEPTPKPVYDKPAAAEDLDATGMSAPPTPDMENEKYDNDVGMPNPEAGDPVNEGRSDQ